MHWRTQSFADHCIPLNFQSYIPEAAHDTLADDTYSVYAPLNHYGVNNTVFPFSMFNLQWPIQVLCLFRHFQCNHGASYLGPRSSDGMDLSLCDTDRRWWPMLSVFLLEGSYQVVR